MNIPKSLIEKVSKKNIVVFVGAGLSMNAGLPSWNKLIEVILDGIGEREPKKDKFKEAIADDILSPLEVLTKIEAHKEYAIEYLDKEIRSYDSVRPTSIHDKIGMISTNIITTNYDCLLDENYPHFEKICYSNNYKISKLSEYKNYIFKIHGDIHEPDKCILFPSQYDELYNDKAASSVFELKKIISDKSVLFIGFSLSDPYINHVFDFIFNVYNGFTPEHYIITSEQNGKWPNRITPIVIPDPSHTENVLQEIIEESKKTPRTEIGTKINIESKDILGISESLEYDLPPQNKYWAGRKKELENISSNIFKVIFITGIGGQGKSSLAAYYMKNCFDSDTYELADWRDFKEETNRFQTKLISIIKRITNKRITSKQLDNVTNKELVDTFFKELGQKGIVFVFDNIDSYIDLEEFKPTGGLGYFFERALDVEHKSKFIFTCRPFIREASLNFYQLKLGGLAKDECHELFTSYKIPLKPTLLKELSDKTYELTKGHPLWLNLIAAQALRGIESVNKFIQNIEEKTNFDEDNFSSILSEKILDSVWNSLNDKQKTLIRGVAETVKPETISELKHILEPELNNNQFNKAFKVLKNLNLLELKSSSISEEQVELHPLVKEFILSKFPQKERAKYITLLVKHYDSFIYILKPKLSSDMSLNSFQNWTSKIELQINKGDFEPALVALEEVSNSILSAGFSEEYLRVAERLFNFINWTKAIENEYSYFHNQFSTLTSTLTQFGRYEKCNELLEKYSKLIPGKGVHYLSYCSEKCYLLWYQGQFQEAIEIGEEGIFILNESGVTDNYSLKHNLALAQRDSQQIENVNKALLFFSRGETLESILEKINTELGGHYYGNIGKCLELLDNKEGALKCYFYSISILFKEDLSYSVLNIGYASYWIFNLLKDIGQKLRALHYLKLSIQSWGKVSPPRAETMKHEWKHLKFDSESKKEINKLPEWKIENFCKEDVKETLLRFQK
ncbi:SIR2 family protein [uncultured Draconibacterium sp.]|uniref:SIR2 family protein n=1 Tax=uncultured Draconibacterium sp. TaxID=1573823 RepID=UPI003216B52E